MKKILRVKLGNKATKLPAVLLLTVLLRSNIDENGKNGAIVELNSETDFVAKERRFHRFRDESAKLVADHSRRS